MLTNYLEIKRGVKTTYIKICEILDITFNEEMHTITLDTDKESYEFKTLTKEEFDKIKSNWLLVNTPTINMNFGSGTSFGGGGVSFGGGGNEVYDVVGGNGGSKTNVD